MMDTREIAHLILENYQQLKTNLDALGYEFAEPEKVIVLANKASKKEVNELEGKYGYLPDIVFELYQLVESVNFSQNEKQLFRDHGEPNLGGVYSLGFHCPMILASPFQVIEEEIIEGAILADGFWITGDFASNCEPKCFGISKTARSFDSYFDEGYDNESSYLNELGDIFATGGFPFWATKTEHLWFIHKPDYMQIKPKLLEGLTHLPKKVIECEN